MKSYIIKIWETEKDRDDGFCDEIEYDNLEKTIEEALNFYKSNACVEVEDEETGDLLLHRSCDGFDGYLDGEVA